MGHSGSDTSDPELAQTSLFAIIYLHPLALGYIIRLNDNS